MRKRRRSRGMIGDLARRGGRPQKKLHVGKEYPLIKAESAGSIFDYYDDRDYRSAGSRV
jgi:hypothetical protein